MAGASTNDYKNAQYYLDPNQQDLLLAALASNQNAKPNNMYSNGAMNNPAAANSGLQYASIDSIDPTFFASPQQVTPDAFGANLNFDNVDDSPFIDYLDGDNSFDFDNGDNGDLMIGGIPGDSSSHSNEGDNENSDKRKSPDDDGDDIEGGGKRREGEDKTAKKPGRKPLTSEPTTVSSANNEACPDALTNIVSETQGTKPRGSKSFP
jgi:AP-1-like factor